MVSQGHPANKWLSQGLCPGLAQGVNCSSVLLISWTIPPSLAMHPSSHCQKILACQSRRGHWVSSLLSPPLYWEDSKNQSLNNQHYYLEVEPLFRLNPNI